MKQWAQAFYLSQNWKDTSRAYLLTQKDWVIIAFGSLSYLGALGRLIKDRSEKHDRSGKDKRGRQAAFGRHR